MSAPDATPPSPLIPSWGRQMQRELHDLRKDFERLKSKTEADALASIHLLAGVAANVSKLHVDVVKLNKQVWGAIKQLRKKR